KENLSISEPFSNQKVRLSPECEDQTLDIKRSDIEAIYERHKDKRLVLSDECKKEIIDKRKSKYEKELEDTCQYAERIQSITRSIRDDDDNPEDVEHKKKIKVLCEIGTLVYREEITAYLDENLEEIDKFSHYLYLKIIDSIDEKSLKGRMKKKMIQTLPFLEKIIGVTNRFLFTTDALQRMHKENLTVNELKFRNNELRDRLLRVPRYFSQKKRKQNRPIIEKY
ncbi:MAG: hypothetical protein NXH75_02480, partial [Halobacteriovoraceae bacterium]|nr:hypothetical protein [Halobacteriovoraceae bacterium]